jgi:hypothetical protein
VKLRHQEGLKIKPIKPPKPRVGMDIEPLIKPIKPPKPKVGIKGK